jgi:hypothetical protein
MGNVFKDVNTNPMEFPISLKVSLTERTPALLEIPRLWGKKGTDWSKDQLVLILTA